MLDPINELRTSLDVLSRSEIEQAWSAAEAVNKALDGNLAQRAEAAAYLLAHILADIGNTTTRPDDLADVAGAVEGLSMYVTGRMITIVSDIGKRRRCLGVPPMAQNMNVSVTLRFTTNSRGPRAPAACNRCRA